MQNEDLSRRLNDMELQSLRHDNASTTQASPVDRDGESTTWPFSRIPGSSNHLLEKENRRQSAFEVALEESQVYRRVKRNECDISFRSSLAWSHALSQLSGISLAQVSSISVIALPILPTDVANMQWYLFDAGQERHERSETRVGRPISGSPSYQSSEYTEIPVKLMYQTNLLKVPPRLPAFDTREQLDRPIDRSEFISTSKVLTYNAPNVLPASHLKSPLSASSSGSSRSDDNLDHARSITPTAYNFIPQDTLSIESCGCIGGIQGLSDLLINTAELHSQNLSYRCASCDGLLTEDPEAHRNDYGTSFCSACAEFREIWGDTMIQSIHNSLSESTKLSKNKFNSNIRVCKTTSTHRCQECRFLIHRSSSTGWGEYAATSIGPLCI